MLHFLRGNAGKHRYAVALHPHLYPALTVRVHDGRELAEEHVTIILVTLDAPFVALYLKVLLVLLTRVAEERLDLLICLVNVGVLP